MECEVCMREFDEDDRRPKVLTCGHTLCWACIKATKRCHKDRMDVLNVDELVDNFYVLGLLDKPYNSLGGRFYCLTCKKPAVSACLDEHDICSLKKVRQGQVTPHLESVRTGVELQRRIVNRLVTLIPVLADTFNRLVEAATEKQDALQHTLDRVSGVLETSGLEESWQDASVTLEEAAKRCEEQRPDLERVLDILESRGKCYLELALQPQGDGQNALSAASETDLAEDTEVTRAVRFVLFLLNSSGNLVEHEAEQQTPADDTQEESDLDSEWDAAERDEDQEDDPATQGAACQELLWASRTRSAVGRGQGRGRLLATLASTSRGRGRLHRARSPVNRENYELLKTLEGQDAVPCMQPFDCPVCLCSFEAGDGLCLKGCLHVFCRECLKDTVQHSETAAVRCPHQDANFSCDYVLSEREIRTIVPPEMFEQHLERSIRAAESSIDNTFHCKKVDCTGWCEFEPGVNQFVCPVCMEKNCLQCQLIHDPENCAEYQDRIRRAAATDAEAKATHEALEAMLGDGTAMRCPKCTVIITKRGGCDGMVCVMCKLSICWATKGPRWGPNGVGDTSGGCRCGVNGKKCTPNCGNCH